MAVVLEEAVAEQLQMQGPGIEQSSSSSTPVAKRHKRRRSRGQKVHILDLKPTQFVAGYAAVQQMRSHMNFLLSLEKQRKRKWKKLIERKRIPVVIGFNSELYMIDHHHFGMSLWTSDRKMAKKQVLIKVVADLSHLSEDEFWLEMNKRGWLYLYFNGVGPLPPQLLPRDVRQLADDPFRSLARNVRGSRKGWKRTPIPFCELRWAEFLRSHASEFDCAVPIDDKANVEALRIAYRLCRSDEAMRLPGWIGWKRA